MRKTKEEKEMEKQEKIEDRKSLKAFNSLVELAKKKDALVSVSYSQIKKLNYEGRN